MTSSKIEQNPIKHRADIYNDTKYSIKRERIFDDITYVTDYEKYNSKAEAKAAIIKVKNLNKLAKARVIERKQGIYIYFDEKTFQKIDSGIIKLKHPVEDEVNVKKKPEKQKVKKLSKDSNFGSNKILVEKYDFPKYLLSRFCKDGKNLMKMGIFEVYQTPKEKLDNYINILSTEQVKFDLNYPKERKVIEYMRDLIKIFENMRFEENDKEAKLFIKKNIIDKKDKFQKHLKMIEKKGIDEVSYLIYKSIKKKAKKYPFGSKILIKKIKELLKSRHI